MDPRAAKRVFFVCLIFFLCMGIGANAQAKFPDKRITWNVTFKAGGGTDGCFRVIAKHAEKALGQTIVIKNITGGGGSVGWAEFKKAKPDGYTLSNINLPHHTIHPLTRDAGYHWTDFEQICIFVTDEVAWYIANDSPFKTWEDLYKSIKENPGKVIFGISNYFTQLDLIVLMFEDLAGVKVQRVPLGGGAGVKTGVLGRHVQVGSSSTSGTYRIRDEVRVLLTAGEKRSYQFPDVPTFKEKGFDIVIGATRGFIAPKGIPQDRLKFWREFFKKLFKDEALLEDLKKAGYPIEHRNHYQLLKQIATDEYKFREILRKRELLRK